MARYIRPVYNITDVFAAACAAFRINGSYIKRDEITFHDNGGHTVDKIANKTLVHQFLKGDFDLRDEDREMGEKVRQYCSSLTFKIISGKTLSEFEQAMLTIADKETTDSNYDIAVVASLPASYERAQARIQQDAMLRDHQGILPDAIGSKVELDIEVVRCNYSNNWETHFVTAIVDNAVVFFASRNKLDIGSKLRIKGKVKDHKEDRTQLSHVKFL
jgi:uncharacterized protein YxjI